MPAQLKMKCPSCREPVAEPVERCPRCRTNLHKLDLQFGVAPKHFGGLTDCTLTFSKADLRKLQMLLDLFHEKFPQSTFSVFVAELPAGIAIGEYTFWLANRVRFSTIESNGEHNFDLLLVLDTAGGAAGLTVGYGLENYLAEEDLSAALELSRTAFAAENWTAGIEGCVHALMKRMRAIARGTKR